MARKNVIEFIVKLIDDASKQLKKLEGNFATFAKKVAMAAVKVGTAVAALGSAFLVLYKNMTKSYAEFSRLSKTLGVSVEHLSQLEYAARQTGVGITTLRNAMERMSPAIDSASDGVGIAADALAELGLSGEKLNKMNVVQQFLTLADAFQKLDNETRALIISQDIFGEGASEIVRLLMGGSSAVLEYAKQAEKLGIVIETRAAREAEKFRQTLTDLEKQFGRIQGYVITTFGPAIDWLARKFTSFVKTMVDGMRSLDAIFMIGETTEYQLEFKLGRLKEQQQAIFDQIRQGKWQIKDVSHILADYSEQIDIATRALEFFRKESATSRSNMSAGDAAAEPLGQFAEIVTKPRLKELRVFRARPGGGDHRPQEIKDIDAELETLGEKTEKFAEQYARKMAFMESLADQAARGIQQSMADFFFDPFEEGLDGMLKSFINVIRRMIAEWLAFQTVTFFGIPGKFSKAVGFAASGGPVTAGNPYIVGERGPELFVPGASGTIVPNHALGGSGGGMNFVTNIDARGADPGLIARLPQIFEQRDRQLMLKVREYIQTGTVSI